MLYLLLLIAHLLCGLGFGANPINIESKEIQEKIGECARLMAHFSTKIHEDVYKKKGCTINRRFTIKLIEKIVTGLKFDADQVEVSFKKPIKPLQLHVPEFWAMERQATNHKRGLFGQSDGQQAMETPAYMFTTSDGLFIISPITKKEFESFQEGLLDYVEHLVSNPTTLLVRVVGMFSIDNLYYAAYVSPFNTLLGKVHLVMEFSHLQSQPNQPKHQGHYPFGNLEWAEFTKNEALSISSNDEQRFKMSYENDLQFLRKQHYHNYEVMIAITNDNYNWSTCHPYDSYYSVNYREKFQPFSISITHFFKRSKKDDKVTLYADEFEVFRKSKVIYGIREGRKSLVNSKKQKAES